MPEPIVVDFRVGGLAEVQRAFRTIADAAMRAERATLTSQAEASGKRVRAAKEETKERQKQINAQVSANRAAAERMLKDDKNLGDGKRRIWEANDRQIVNALKQVERAKRDARRRELNDEVELYQRKAGLLKKHVKNTKDIEDAAYNRHVRAQALSGGVVRGIRGGAGAVAGMTGRVVRGALSLGGGFDIDTAIREDIELRKQSANINVATNKKSRGNEGVSTQGIYSTARNIAKTEGISALDVVEGLGKFKDITGETGRALKLAPQLARVATVYGGNLQDFMGQAAEIAASDTGKKLTDEDILNTIRIQSAQGQEFSVENKDMAKFGARLTGSASFMAGGAGIKNMATASGLAQLAKRSGSADNPTGATLSSLRFMQEVSKKGAKIQKAIRDAGNKNFSLLDSGGNVLDTGSALAEMAEATKGDKSLAARKFGLTERAHRVMIGASNIYREGYTDKEGTKHTGKEAVKKFFDDVVKPALDKNEEDQKHAERMAEADKKIEVAFEELKTTVGSQLVPELIRLVPVLKETIAEFVKLAGDGGLKKVGEFITEIGSMAKELKGNSIVQALAAHPIASVMGAYLVKEIAIATFGEKVREMILAKMSGGVGGVSAPSGAGGATSMSIAGAVTIAAMAGVAVNTAVKPIIDGALSGQTSGQFATGQLIGEAKNGDVQKAEAALARAEDKTGVVGTLKTLFSLIPAVAGFNTGYSLVTGEKNATAESVKDYMKAREIVNSEELRKAIADAVVGGVKDGVTGSQPRSPSAPISDPHR